jgi:kynureninase
VFPPAREVSAHLAARGVVVDVLHPAELRRAG